MAGIPLNELGKAIAVRRPRYGGVYFKRFSYPKGATPSHLAGYTEKFTSAAKGCVGAMAGLKGNEKVWAFNYCISSKLKK